MVIYGEHYILQKGCYRNKSFQFDRDKISKKWMIFWLCLVWIALQKIRHNKWEKINSNYKRFLLPSSATVVILDPPSNSNSKYICDDTSI